MDLTKKQRRNLRTYFLNILPDIFQDVVDVHDRSHHQKWAIREDAQKYNFCLSISYAVAKVLKTYGFQCDAMGAKVCFANERMRKQMKNGVSPEEINADQSCWSVSIGYPHPSLPPDEYPLHAVVYFPTENSILDMTAKQANRPKHDLLVQNFWTMRTKLPESIIAFEMYQLESWQIENTFFFQYSHRNELLMQISKAVAEILEVSFRP